ncbi:uncharacterized protein LOC126668269 [Mercurialis annua]|uniref:uncharacterized protein LOC126668269 n=1 Tax=Mercurialis annua TaxID=3986 RepID=UPI00215F9EC4|nr:uncharacterized protein LOC126668269 [Mercurialis annua]
MEISQDVITGMYQSSDTFWSRVWSKYNKEKNNGWEERIQRSVQAQIQTIEEAVRKLNGSIKQIENMNPSGASNEDILQRAKMLLTQDPLFIKGFKFDHVWHIIKDFEKFKDNNNSPRQVHRLPRFNNISSESEYSPSESQIPKSPEESPFSDNLEDHNIGGSSRPIGVKKAKLKRKIAEQFSTIVSIKEQNDKVIELLEKSGSDRQEQMKMQNEQFLFRKEKEENKILFIDLNTISNPRIRAITQAEQEKIIQKKRAATNDIATR